MATAKRYELAKFPHVPPRDEPLYVIADYTDWRHFGQRFVVNVMLFGDHFLWMVVNIYLLVALSMLALALGAYDCMRWTLFTATPKTLAIMYAKAAPRILAWVARRILAWVILPAWWILAISFWRVIANPLGLVLVPTKAARWVLTIVLSTALKSWTYKWPRPSPERVRWLSSLSAVNAETPNIHTSYCSTPGDFTSIDLQNPKIHLDNAIFFLHLSALVYENEDTLNAALQQWHLRSEAVIHGEGYTGCAAWVIYHSPTQCQAAGHNCHRPNQDFLVVVFKGASPFDCVGWMTDFTMLKTKPYGESLPGMIHEGFFKEFEWPRYLKPIPGEHPLPPTPQRVTEGYVCDQRDIASRLAMDGRLAWPDDDFHPPLSFYERLIRTINWVIHDHFRPGEGRQAAMWITGHSMGGALASIFFAHLLHVPKPHPLIVHPKHWLMGGYTFGAPRTGDTRYATQVRRHPQARHFYDVTNANDAVHYFPPAQDLRLFRDERTLTNFAHIGKPVLLSYWGTHTEVAGAGFFESSFVHIGSFICHWLSFPFYLLRTERPWWEVLLRWFCWLPLWFVFDHLPTEYLRHLEACKNRQATTTATKVHKATTTSECGAKDAEGF